MVFSKRLFCLFPILGPLALALLESAALAVSGAEEAADSAAPDRAAAMWRGVQRIVFLGDSITQGGDYVTDCDCWLLAHGFQVEVLNLGLASETASDLTAEENAPHLQKHGFGRPFVSERLDRALAATKPDWLFACYGMNDAENLPPDAGGTRRFAEAITNLRDSAAKAGVKRVILCTPPVYDEKGDATQRFRDESLGRYTAWLLSRRADGWDVVDIHTPMRRALDEGRTKNPAFKFANDGVHPGREGHWLMTRQILTGFFGAKLDGVPCAEDLFPAHGRQIRELVQERMVLRFNAWMTQIGHTRPGVAGGPGAKAGPPITQANNKAADLAKRIHLEMAGSGLIGPRISASEPLLRADFASNPVGAGWELKALPNQKADGGWVETEGHPQRHCLRVQTGYWQSPAMAVSPFQYYRLSFRSRTASRGYWCAVFFNAEGKELAADVYDSVYESVNWQAHTFCVRAHAEAKEMRLRFQPIETPLFLAEAGVEASEQNSAAAWAGEVAAGCPALHFLAPPGRWERLPRTMKTLREGGKLRVVILGDSIANDTSNSMFETLLKRVYPQASLEIVTSVRGGAGCWYYKDESRVRDYVLRFQPDLVIIGGISARYDGDHPAACIEAFRSVIRQIRAGADCEFLLLSGSLCPVGQDGGHLKLTGQALRRSQAELKNFASQMAAMAGEEKAEFFDIHSAWDAYIQASPQPQQWFMRDPVHANSRGKQVVGRILCQYLSPAEPGFTPIQGDAAPAGMGQRTDENR